MSNLDIIRGRQTIIPLTNKSGGAVVAGDLVVIDETTDESFTTTATDSTTVSIGIAQESIANNASGRVLVAGYAPLLNTALISWSRGDYIYHGSNTKTARGSNTRTTGAFGQFLETGTTPSGWIWPMPDAAAVAGGALGAWTDYTPTWAGSGAAPAIGNGTLTGRYKELDGTTLAVQIRLSWGSTTTAGSTLWTFSLPSGYTSGAKRQTITCWGIDTGTSYYVGAALIAASATVISEVLLGNHLTINTCGLNTPFTWATGDELIINGIIETT